MRVAFLVFCFILHIFKRELRLTRMLVLQASIVVVYSRDLVPSVLHAVFDGGLPSAGMWPFELCTRLFAEVDATC